MAEYWVSSDMTSKLKDDNSSSFVNFTELGWEASVGRLKIIRMIQEGKLTSNDSVIVIKDRMFMYPFCNVVAFDPNNIPVKTKTHPHDYGKWLHELHKKDKDWVPWRWKEDIPMILDFDFEEANPPPCIVINHRIRGWVVNRNIKNENTQKLVSMILSLGLKPYISGKYANKVDDRAEYIPTLRKLASIIHHPHCKAFVSAGGTTLLAQQCCRNKLICINAYGKMQRGKNPLYFSPKFNFTGCKEYLISKDISIPEVRRMIEEK